MPRYPVSLKGSLKHVDNESRKEALRSNCSLKRMVDTSTIFRIIDSLLKPVAAGAYLIWLPSNLHAYKIALKHNEENLNIVRSLVKYDLFEGMHLKMLKWILCVHNPSHSKKSSQHGKHGSVSASSDDLMLNSCLIPVW